MKTVFKETKIDLANAKEYEINGCKVRLFFTLGQNEGVEKVILNNLMQVVERKKQEVSNVQTEQSHLRHA